ncbi:hypothetical protein BH18ACI4_BH18ACI4_05870 [soil metagenome]
MTLETTDFLTRVTLDLDFSTDRSVILAILGVFLREGVEVRFGTGFLAWLFDAADLRPGGFATAALLALARPDVVCTERPLTEDFEDDRRAAVRDVDRLMPLVTGLLIRKFRLKGQVAA